jgi:hypothetical protein
LRIVDRDTPIVDYIVTITNVFRNGECPICDNWEPPPPDKVPIPTPVLTEIFKKGISHEILSQNEIDDIVNLSKE